MDSEFNFPVLLFDGVCKLCSASVQWVLSHDRQGRFRFASLQSARGQQLLGQFGLSAATFDTVVLIAGSRVFTRSDAVLETARQLGPPWSWLYPLHWAPRGLRDAVYDWLARRRYRWFGRRETCWLPRPEWKNRFL